ncbi:hypothetical protein ACFVZT_43050 [Streptomyces sp. NPDC058321]|uniref:hypothetical protein n=1 Tax=Streptomyces sp. NPDC058321 TaxID=3346445 RepID=UPI0036EC99D9
MLADLDLLLASDKQWCWAQGDAYAGKTALLAWLVIHPPPYVALASCFLRSTDGTNTADYALSTLTGQLAALADRFDYHPARFLPEKRAQFVELLSAAARACRERGHRLVLVIDGLDEYDWRDGPPLRDWLIGDGELPAETALLTASRSRVDLCLPASHPLHAHVLPLTPTDAAVELHALAEEELRRALADRSRLEHTLVGLAAAAEGGLRAADLQELLRRMGISAFITEIADTLSTSLRRTVTPVPDSTGRTVFAFAHAALKDAARAKVAEDLADFEATLIDWCDDYRHSGWPENTPDYVLSHYPRHLHAADRLDELVTLLEDRAWYQRHEVFDPSTAAYVSGVETVWRAAEVLDQGRARAGMSADRLGAEIRACLTVSSVASLWAGIGPQLLSALVGSGVWSRQHALDVARLAPPAEERAELLVALAGEGPDDDLRSDAVRAAMAAIMGIVDEMQRARMWQKLAPLVPSALLDDALRLSDSLPRQIPDGQHPRVVAEAALLARAAAVGFPDRALDAVRAMEYDSDRASALAEVARSLPADRIDEALVLVRELRWEPSQVEPLGALAVAALDSRADGETLLREAFDATLGLASPRLCSRALRRLAPALPESWVDEALEATRFRLDLGNRWTCLTALATRLGVLDQWRAALEVARELQDSVWRVRILVAVAPYVPESETSALAEEMFDATQKLDRIHLPGELVGVAPHLNEPTLRRALEWAGGLEAETGVAVASALLPRLADLGHAQEAYNRAVTAQETGWRYGAEAWADLAPHLPKALGVQACRKALRLATSIDDLRERLLARVSYAGALGDEAVGDLLRSLGAMDGFARGVALRRLVRHVPDYLLPEVVEVAMTVNATERFAGTALASPRADVLAALAPRLHGVLRDQALESARAAVAEVDIADERNAATLRIAAAFSAPDVATTDAREAVARRIRVAGRSWRARQLQEVGAFLPADLVHDLEAKQQAADARRVERVNVLLAPDPQRNSQGPPARTLHTALAEAKYIHTQGLRATALSQLAPHLMVLLERKDSDDTEEDWIRSRADVLTALAPHLSHDQLPDALSSALDLQGSPWARGVLASLAGPLGTLPQDRLHPLWQRTLHALALFHRPQTLQHLRSLRPVVRALGGQAAARDLVRAVRETGDWWP